MYLQKNYYQKFEAMFRNMPTEMNIPSIDPDATACKAKEQLSRTWHICSPEKQAAFERLARQADLLAETQALDISVISTGGKGIIGMTGECLMFPNTGSKTWDETKQTLLNLIAHADDVVFHPENGKQNIQLIYYLCDEITD